MSVPNNDWAAPSEISIRTMNTMRGKLCSLIESMDLPNKTQERAVVAQLKQYTYDAQSVIAQLLDIVDNGNTQVKHSNRLLEVKDDH